MASPPNSKLVTYEEWLEMPEVDDQIEEVVNGEIRLLPPNKWIHAETTENLRDQLLARLDRNRFYVVTAEFGLIIRESPLTSRVPDLAVFDREKIIERDGYIHSAPRLIVEIVSPANRRRQREEKLLDYASLGVPEFWCVWPDRREIEVFLLENGAYRLDRVLSDGAVRATSLPNVEIAIPAIWPR